MTAAANVLLGRAEDQSWANTTVVYTTPQAWRCSVCGGGLISGPRGKDLFHPCGDERQETSRYVRYVGLRAHARKVWAVTWGNRPRVVTRTP